MTILEAQRARLRIAAQARRTPLVQSTWLSRIAGATVWLKLESLQKTNSFKFRGALNAVMARWQRDPRGLTRLVTASAGNHGRALATAAESFHLPLVVFTPADAPAAKLGAIEEHGAELRAKARDYDEAERLAKAFAAETGAAFVSPYNDADVIAGAATIALELFEDLGHIDAILVPIGGGGLISGVAAAAKAIDPACRIIGVEAAQSCAFQTSLRAGRLVEIVPGPTLADGLGGNPDPDTMTFSLIQRFVDEVTTVAEDDIARAIAGLVEFEHLVAEGAGAVAVAALLAAGFDRQHGQVVTIVSGSNIDRSRLEAVLAASNVSHQEPGRRGGANPA